MAARRGNSRPQGPDPCGRNGRNESMASLAAAPRTDEAARPMSAEERKVIIASSAGTVFEWYDFYLAGSLAANISANFFSGVNPTAGFIFTLLGFAAGFA